MPVNYNLLAPTYHQRHDDPQSLPGIAEAVRRLAREYAPPGATARVLEVGCGTGRWLDELQAVTTSVFGLDFSPGMLREAQHINPALPLACGEASALPYPAASFDVVFCAMALHHFSRPQQFFTEALRVLRPGGCLAVINLDPHRGRDVWYIHDYFEGTRETDLRRFPSSGQLLDWAAALTFTRATWQVIEQLRDEYQGRAILDSYFFQKPSSSQLALLSDEAYAAGRAHVLAEIERAEAAGDTAKFFAHLDFILFTAQAPETG